MNSKNLVLVDCENLGQLDLQPLHNCAAKVVLFIGLHQKSVTVEFLKEALELRPKLSVIKSPAAGKDALDFQMAFHAGKVAAIEPTTHFFFVTNDKGFDALVLQMNSEGLVAQRVPAIGKLPFLQAPAQPANCALDPLQNARAFLAKQLAVSRPRKRQTLNSSLAAHFAKKLSTKQIEALIDELIESGCVTVSPAGAVTYTL